MTSEDVAGASRPTRRLTIVSVIIWALLAFALPLAALTLNALQVAGFPLGFWFAAQGAFMGLIALVWVFRWRAGGEGQREGIVAPLVFAGEVISSAGFIGFAGMVAALGYDGLAYPLGTAAGLALMAVLIAPRFVLYPAATFGGFASARFGGTWTRRIALSILGLCTLLLLAADLRGAGLALEALAGLDLARGIAIGATVLTAAWAVSALVAKRRRFGVVFLLLIGTFSAVLIVFTLQQGRMPLPYWSYGIALQDVASVELALITQKLADVRALKPMASPFLQLSMVNFAGIVLALALGIAALPQLLGRHLSQATVAPGESVRRTALTLTLVAVFLCGAAPFAVFVRAAVAKLLQQPVKVTELPPGVVDAAARGWISVCGANGATAAELAGTCAKTGGHKGLLRLQDLAFNNDAFLFAGARIADVSGALWYLLGAAALAAALVAGHALLAGFLEAVSEPVDAPPGASAAERFSLRNAALAILLMLAAVACAAMAPTELVSLAAEGLSLLAASLFPVVLLGLYWRRFNAPAAIATMLTGFLAGAVYVLGVRAFPLDLYALTGHLSNAAPNAVSKLTTLRHALEAATDPADVLRAQRALYDQALLVANWWGLRPAASVLFALPAALLAGISVTLMTSPPPARTG